MTISHSQAYLTFKKRKQTNSNSARCVREWRDSQSSVPLLRRFIHNRHRHLQFTINHLFFIPHHLFHKWQYCRRYEKKCEIIFHLRYEILKVIGKGSFGQVLKVYDHKTHQHVALKMVRNEKRFHRQAQEEIRILEHLRKQDKDNTCNIIHMFDNFSFR